MNNLLYAAEAAFLKLLFTALRILPLDVASFIGGFIGRSVGPFLSAHKIAKRNLALAFPEKSEEERHRIAMQMWDNLGRVGAEFSRLPEQLLLDRVEISGTENLPPLGSPIIFFSGHIGNWELTYPYLFRRGFPITLIYRAANNPYVDKMICDLRASQSADSVPKGLKGAVKLARSIKKGQSLAMLVDQKMNDGIPIPFFGRDAMTAPAIAEFALRYNLPMIPARIIRTKGCHFKGLYYPPLAFEKTGDKEKDIRTIMTLINQTFESWIREEPAQWFWVHKRWPS